MTTPTQHPTLPRSLQTSQMLLALNLPAHRLGYSHLCIAIPYFAEDFRRGLTKDVYPFVAAQYGNVSWSAIEQTIRHAILYGWENGDPEVWAEFFPNAKKAPTNKQFIATLAKRLK